MPSSSEHSDKAELHVGFLRTINATTQPEWAAVVAFYTALHLIERLAACESIHHDRHQTRLFYLLRHKKHRIIHSDMSVLRDASEKARYGTVNQFRRAFPGDRTSRILIGECLARIQEHVEASFKVSNSPSEN